MSSSNPVLRTGGRSTPSRTCASIAGPPTTMRRMPGVTSDTRSTSNSRRQIGNTAPSRSVLAIVAVPFVGLPCKASLPCRTGADGGPSGGATRR